MGLTGEALEHAALRLLGSPELFLLLPREVALVVFGVSLDQGLDGAGNLLVANAASNIVEDVLNVLKTSSFDRFKVAVKTTFENDDQSWVHGHQVVDYLAVPYLCLTPWEPIILKDWLNTPKVSR